MNVPLQSRKDQYYLLSNQLTQLGSKQLAGLLGDNAPSRGWGATHTIKQGQSKVFIKRIPVTQLEYENLFSTENLYGMPTFYNYGVGSAGFGAFRELAAHVKTTNWVLDGALPNFPLMYHYRIVPFTGQRAELDTERHEGYVKYWNNDANIDRYIRDRSTASYELIIFLEHFPDILHHWLAKNIGGSETIIQEMQKTIAFMREQGMLHFDAHFGNILVREGIPYLTDFGLVLDKSFALSTAEKAFFRRHIDYDDAEFLLCLGSYTNALYRNLSPGAKAKVMRKYGISEDIEYGDLVSLLLENIDEIHKIHASRLIKLDDYYVAEIMKHRDLIKAMRQFYREMRAKHKKNASYPQAIIHRSRNEAGLR